MPSDVIILIAELTHRVIGCFKPAIIIIAVGIGLIRICYGRYPASCIVREVNGLATGSNDIISPAGLGIEILHVAGIGIDHFCLLAQGIILIGGHIPALIHQAFKIIPVVINIFDRIIQRCDSFYPSVERIVFIFRKIAIAICSS